MVEVGVQMATLRYYEPQDMFTGAKIVVHHQEFLFRVRPLYVKLYREEAG